MGKFLSKFRRSGTAEEEPQRQSMPEPPKKEYSWDTRARIDPKEYTFENLKNATVGKLPATLNGQPFIIQQCQDTNVFIFDHSATITVDDCTNCQFYFGPVRGSVFMRNCRNCRAVIACQQFRLRDCSKFDVFLACATQPIIEASSNIRIGCFQLHYSELSDQFRAAKVNMLSVNWCGVHDFTPVSGMLNYSLKLAESQKPTDIIKAAAPTESEDDQTKSDGSQRDAPNSATRAELADFCAKLTCDVQSSVVPLTFGVHQRVAEEATCLVVLFCEGDMRASELDERGLKLARAVYEPFEPSSCRVIRAQCARVDSDDFSRIFGEEAAQRFGSLLRKPIAALELNGTESKQRCETALSHCSITASSSFTISDGSARSTASQFFDFLSSQLNP